MTRRQRKIVWALSIYSLVGLILLWVLIPILYILLASLQPEVNLISVPLKISLSDFGVDGYREAFANDRIIDGLKNSAIVAGLATLIVLVVGLSAAYPLLRRTGRIRWWVVGMLATQTVPVITLVIPVFIVFHNLDPARSAGRAEPRLRGLFVADLDPDPAQLSRRGARVARTRGADRRVHAFPGLPKGDHADRGPWNSGRRDLRVRQLLGTSSSSRSC